MLSGSRFWARLLMPEHAALIVALSFTQLCALANCLIDSGQTDRVNVQCLHIRLAFCRQLGKNISSAKHIESMAHTWRILD